jgi:hypothetical protein
MTTTIQRYALDDVKISEITITHRKPRARRRRNCRKCGNLHQTINYHGSLWYCEPCAENLDHVELVEYMTCGEFKRYMAKLTLPGVTVKRLANDDTAAVNK